MGVYAYPYCTEFLSNSFTEFLLNSKLMLTLLYPDQQTDARRISLSSLNLRINRRHRPVDDLLLLLV